jgi:hypothetical protein
LRSAILKLEISTFGGKTDSLDAWRQRAAQVTSHWWDAGRVASEREWRCGDKFLEKYEDDDGLISTP